MGWFTVVARKDGQVEFLTGDKAKDVKLNDGDRNVGEFHAENEPEARRQFCTLNPSVNMETGKVSVQADSEAAVADQRREFEAGVLADAVDALEIPDDTGDPQEEEEVEHEEDDPTAEGGKRKVVKKVKKVGTGRAKKAATTTKGKK